MKQMKQTIRIISVICSEKKDICCTFAKVFYQNYIFYKVFKMLKLKGCYPRGQQPSFLPFYSFTFAVNKKTA